MTNYDIAEAIKYLNRMLRRRGAVLNSQSYGRGHGRLLRLIAEKDGITNKELAEAMNIRPPSLTKKLAILEKDGNIYRLRDERDKRLVRIHISEQGKQTLEKRRQEELTLNKQFYACLSEEEQAVFYHLCYRMIADMEKQLKKENLI